jgi:hypothetical protein
MSDKHRGQLHSEARIPTAADLCAATLCVFLSLTLLVTIQVRTLYTAIFHSIYYNISPQKTCQLYAIYRNLRLITVGDVC